MDKKTNENTIKSVRKYWTIFSLVVIFLALIAIQVWINVLPMLWRPEPGTPEPIKIEGDLEPPRVMNKVELVYPEKAKKAGIKGEIILEVKTDLHGKVESAKVINIVPSYKLGSEMSMLYKAARDAVLQWRFEPFDYRGQIRGAIFTVSVKFE